MTSHICSPPAKRTSICQKKDTSTRGICCYCQKMDDFDDLKAARTSHATKTKTNIDHAPSNTKIGFGWSKH